MNKPTLILLPLASLLFASCGNNSTENYDTQPTSGLDSAATTPPAHPTYGEAAYEDSTTPTTPITSAAPTSTPLPPTGIPSNDPSTAAVPAPKEAQEYYVAPGDSLWKISSKFKVPIASIKAANNMTTDTVVLGKKMIIPAK
jgi:LysM repeat protein